MKYSLFLSLLIFSFFAKATANSSEETILSAKAVKAIYDKGFKLPQIIDVDFAEQNSSPRKVCVMVIYDRKPNTECPDNSMIGPNFDKGYAACLDSANKEIESVTGMQTPDC